MDPIEYLFSLEKLGIKFGLDNIQRLTAALGSPQASFRSILIAGTNGKGSVAAMVERALRAAGLRTARYTSPHLIHLEERFFIEGNPVDSHSLREAAAHVQATIQGLLSSNKLAAQPTFFEVTTAIAFELFRRRRVEIAVLEVGLGGRYDATNVVMPVMTAITSIDLDHEALLGSRLADIASEKAGIIKSDVPVIVGETKPEPVDVIASTCRERGGSLIHAASETQAISRLEADGRILLDLTTPKRRYPALRLSLRGRHQARNALTAVRLLEELPSLVVSERAIAAGLTDVYWPGRLDVVEGPDGRSMLLDSAHNPAGAAALAAYLAEMYPERLPVIFGAMHDKDAERMLVALRSCASAFVLTAPHLMRAASAESLAAMVARVAPGMPAYTAPDVESAAALAWRLGPTVCGTGSIFLIGEILLFFDHCAPPSSSPAQLIRNSQ